MRDRTWQAASSRGSVMRDRARQAAANVVPVAKNAIPLARNASDVARQRAEAAMEWMSPRVSEARSWAAPYVERTGIAVRDTIAPKVSDALVTAAHRLDGRRPPRRWPKVVAGIAMLVAAGCAAAAAFLLSSKREPELTEASPSVNGGPQAGPAGGKPDSQSQES
jgi:hypothetical protein